MHHYSTLQTINSPISSYGVAYQLNLAIEITLRYNIFGQKKDPPKVKSLPPTDEAAVQHIKRVHLQTIIWDAADQINSPDVDVINFGYQLDNNDIPQPVYGPTDLIPPDLQKVVACTCSSNNPCGTNRCSCKISSLSCTTYCKCIADINCPNEYTVSTASFENEYEIDDIQSLFINIYS